MARQWQSVGVIAERELERTCSFVFERDTNKAATETLTQVAQNGGGCPVPGDTQAQAG